MRNCARGPSASCSSSRGRRPISICRSTFAAPRSRRGYGARCARSRPAAPPAMPRSPPRSARPGRCAPSPGPAPPTALPCWCRATASCAATAGSAAIAGASRGNARCSPASARPPPVMPPPRRANSAGPIRRPGGGEVEARIAARLAAIDWAAVTEALDGEGFATLPALLDRRECRALADLYSEEAWFRSRVVMQRHAFGRGEYKYLRYPLPPLVAALRRCLYARLAPLAELWRERLGEGSRLPPTLEGYLAQCHAAGQRRPTPLLLHYEAGDYNCLHQDLYGKIAFPFQVVICLSRPQDEFTGGELLLVEQRPRAQSVGHAIRLEQGEAVAITTRYRPVKGARGWYRSSFRHGVSPLLTGERYTLGLIFHDAA